jgi:organic radical activating enzyme
VAVLKFVDWKRTVPLSVHLLITSRCNMNCPKCYYRGEGEVSVEKATQLFDEWASHGVVSVAIGGGEPLLHPEIERMTFEAKKRGFYVAVTTNGTVLKRVYADRVHVSYDGIHETSFEQARRALKYFKTFVPSVGVNHVATDISLFKQALKLDASTVTVLMEKPSSQFKAWSEVFALAGGRVWVDACLAQRLGLRMCRQGATSMCVDQRLMASKCSNIREKVPYTTLTETWGKVRRQAQCLVGLPRRATSNDLALNHTVSSARW